MCKVLTDEEKTSLTPILLYSQTSIETIQIVNKLRHEDNSYYHMKIIRIINRKNNLGALLGSSTRKIGTLHYSCCATSKRNKIEEQVLSKLTDRSL